MALSQTLLKSRWVKGYMSLLFFFEKFIGPFLFLTVRIWMARIYWDSGLTKIQSWPTTIMLFKQVYKVPDISPTLAAFLTTLVELSCPVLLVMGLATRIASIPMLVVVLVIEFTFLARPEHLYWMMLLTLLICYGPGTISVDFCLRKWLLGRDNKWKSL